MIGHTLHYRFSFYLGILSLLFLLFTIPLYTEAQEGEFIRYTRKNGLPQNDVLCLYQDSKGLMWIGTNDGLCSFDGYKFKTYQMFTHNLPSNLISSISEDKKGYLWIGTIDAGIVRYNPFKETFTYFQNTLENPKLFTSNQVRQMVFDKDNNLWFCNGEGVNFISASSLYTEHLEVQKYYHSPHNPESVLHRRVYSVKVDHNGILWVGTKVGLQKFIPSKNKDDKRGTFKSYLKKGDNMVLDIEVLEDKILVIYLDGVHEFGKNEKFTRLVKQRCNSILFDRHKTLWAASSEGKGLMQLKAAKKGDLFQVKGLYSNNIYDKSSLSKNDISCIYEDKMGVIWIGTMGGGLNKYNPNRKLFRHIKKTSTKGSLSYNQVRAIYEDDEENLWVGTEGDGLNLLPSSQKENYHTGFKHIPISNQYWTQGNIYSIGRWRNKVFMGVASPFRGLITDADDIQRSDKKIKDRVYTDFIKNAVFNHANDGDSILWLATYNGGLIRGTKKENHKKIQWSSIENTSSIISVLNETADIIRSVLVDKNGNLWVGTNYGLYIIDAEEKEKEHPRMRTFLHQHQNAESISHNYILPIFETTKGEIWVGTMGGGINIVKDYNDLDNIKFEHLSINNGLSNNVIKAMLEDDNGNIWVSSNHGISKVNPSTQTINNFDLSDGLQGYEFGELAACKRKNGEFLFGGVNGISAFYPDKIMKDTTTSNLVFTKFQVLNKDIAPMEKMDKRVILQSSIAETKSLTLAYKHNSFSVEFAYLHYITPEKNTYRYKLEGFDDAWVTTNASSRIAKYTNLPFGNYTLKVEACNGDNIWSKTPLTLDVTILPPWWMTWWAISFYILLFIVAIWFFTRYTIITARKKEKLERQAFEKQTLEELNQLKLEFFTNISHELRTPVTLINTPIEQLIKNNETVSESDKNTAYQMIYRNAQHLMKLINQLMDFRKVEQGKMRLNVYKQDWSAFVKEVSRVFEQLADYHDITFEFSLEQTDVIGYIDTDKIEKILYNILSNAFKFTKEGSISVALNADQKDVHITIADTGIGIPQEKLEHLFNRFYQVTKMQKAKYQGTGIGLSFTKSLIDLHHGSIAVESKEGEGTTFRLSFPLADKYYEGDSKQEIPSEATILNIEELKPVTVVEEEETQDEEKPIILVVDDNQSIRLMLHKLLSTKFTVKLAEDGEQAYMQAKEELPHLILSDIMMPVLDGYGLVEKLRQDEDTCHLPIILLTAKSSDENKLKGYELGIDAYVSKPFDADILMAQVSTLLANRRRQQKRFRTNINVEPSEITVTSLDTKFINRIINIIEHNIDDSSFTVEQLAYEYGSTSTRLNQKLKALTGQNMKGFIRNIRVKRAAQMLKIGRHNISEVAYAVGFNDLKYFGTCFKSEFGMTPSKYKLQESDNSSSSVEGLY